MKKKEKESEKNTPKNEKFLVWRYFGEFPSDVN